jgi:CubicO group peptidase (beta-lactamase class C family)
MPGTDPRRSHDEPERHPMKTRASRDTPQPIGQTAAAPGPVSERGTTSRIDGDCDPAFAGVEEAFRENFRSRNEIGAALCVRVGGRVVVDLWGGHRDAARTRPWTRDTLVNAYSVGKGITAMLVLSLVERGELDLDEPVARRWPEFAAEGKSEITLRMLLAHRGGLPGVRRPLPEDAMLDWQTMTSALAAQAPWWPPDRAHGYHVNTHGFLVGHPVVRRLGLSFADALRERVTGPAGADFHIGLPRTEHARVATIVDGARGPVTDVDEAVAAFVGSGDAERDAMLASVYFNPPGLSGFGTVNTPGWRLASIPSTNSHGTARAVATLYDLFLRRDVGAGGLVGSGLRDEARRIHSDGVDRVLGKPSRFGLGFQLTQPTRPIGRSDAGFGHFGYGGTLGFADPENEIAFGYLMNRPGERWSTPRTNTLVDAVYEALGVAASKTA